MTKRWSPVTHLLRGSRAPPAIGYNFDSCAFCWHVASLAYFSFKCLPKFNHQLLLSFAFPFCLQIFKLLSNTFLAKITISPLFCLRVLAYNICGIMTKSISLRFSLMICIRTVHSCFYFFMSSLFRHKAHKRHLTSHECKPTGWP